VLAARRRGYATQLVRRAGPATRGEWIDFSLAATSGRGAGPNSANRLVFWSSCDQVAALSEAQVDRLTGAGVDGFVCSAERLRGMGGNNQFSGSSGALRGPQFSLQRRLRRSAVVKRARARRLNLYLGFYANDSTNPTTPFKDWFDDRAWSKTVLPQVRGVAAAARALGFVGVALDQELYTASNGEETPTWNWDYPGEGHSEAAVRAQVARRGRQLMEAMVTAFPGLEIAAYDTKVPGDWSDKVQDVINGQSDAAARDVRIDLWDGLSSVQGYSAIRWLDSIFYKMPHLGGEDWSVGLRFNANRIYALLSRRFSNWAYASARLQVTPFGWIDNGPSPGEAARDPGYVARQLDAFRRWGAGGTIANYAYGSPASFDYRPYTDAMKSASTPGTVDREPPSLDIGALPTAGGTPGLEGKANDDSGIRVVRWYDDRGRFGTAQVTTVPRDGVGLSGDWDTSWRIPRLPVSKRRDRVTVVAEDVKGLATVRTLTLGG
jgi:hypothetical protein